RSIAGARRLQHDGLEEPARVGEVPLGRARFGHRLQILVLGRKRRRQTFRQSPYERVAREWIGIPSPSGPRSGTRIDGHHTEFSLGATKGGRNGRSDGLKKPANPFGSATVSNWQKQRSRFAVPRFGWLVSV